MSASSPTRADPHRELHSREWYEQNAPNSNRLSWALHLCVSAEVIEDFVPQVRAALHAAALAGRPVAENTPHALLLVSDQLWRLRPDLVSPQLPFKAFVNVISSMARKLNNDARLSEVPERGVELNVTESTKRKINEENHTTERPEKQARLASGNEACFKSHHQEDGDLEGGHDSEETIASAGTKYKQNGRNQRMEETTIAHHGANHESSGTMQLPSRTFPAKPNFDFDPELVTVSILDSARIGNVQIVPLKEISYPYEPFDIRTCKVVTLDALEISLGVQTYNPYEEKLWCEVDGVEHSVISQETFEILCRWQVEDSLARNPKIPPRIRFEKRPLGPNTEVCDEASRDMRPRIVAAVPSVPSQAPDSTSPSEPTSSSGPSSSESSSLEKSTEEGKDRPPSIQSDLQPLAEDEIELNNQSDSDSDRPLLQSRETKTSNSSEKNHATSDSPARSSSPLSAIVVLSQPLSNRRSTMSEQLLEDFQKPLLPTPSAEAQEATQPATIPDPAMADTSCVESGKKKKRNKKHKKKRNSAEP